MGKRWRFKEVVRTDERKEWRDAVYQYLIDHGTWTGKLWQTTIHFEDKRDLEWRVKSRMFGVRRNDEEQAKKEVQTFLANFGQFRSYQQANDKFINKMNEIDKSGTLIEKTALWFYRQSRKYILD